MRQKEEKEEKYVNGDLVLRYFWAVVRGQKLDGCGRRWNRGRECEIIFNNLEWGEEDKVKREAEDTREKLEIEESRGGFCCLPKHVYLSVHGTSAFMAGFLKSSLTLVFHCPFKSAAGTGHFFSSSHLRFWVMVGHSLSLNSCRISAPRCQTTLKLLYCLVFSPLPSQQAGPLLWWWGRRDPPLPHSLPHPHFPLIPCLPAELLSGGAFPLHLFSWPCPISQTCLHFPVLLWVSYFWGPLFGEPLPEQKS